MVLVVRNLPANAEDIRDTGSIPRLGRFPGGGRGNPLHYSCLENPMDRGHHGLQSIGSQRIGHDQSNLACTHACTLPNEYGITADISVFPEKWN